MIIAIIATVALLFALFASQTIIPFILFGGYYSSCLFPAYIISIIAIITLLFALFLPQTIMTIIFLNIIISIIRYRIKDDHHALGLIDSFARTLKKTFTRIF